MKQIHTILFLFTATILFSCDGTIFNNESESQQSTSSEALIQADKDFSRMSTERGMKTALMHYMAREGILLRPDEKPLVGADAIEYISQINDSGYKVSLNPIRADISGDGSLGYTYGTYEVAVQDTLIKGTYVNIWKKQNGAWRFMLNSGNQGTGSN